MIDKIDRIIAFTRSMVLDIESLIGLRETMWSRNNKLKTFWSTFISLEFRYKLLIVKCNKA